jgi:predicted nucleic acid-binding protein
MFLLDSSVMIEAIRLYGPNAGEFIREKYGRAPHICVLSVAELYAGKSVENREVELLLDFLLSAMEMVAVDKVTAIQAGKLRRHYNLDISDATIASAAIANNLTLVTHNKKHFAKIKDLKLEAPHA